MDDMNLIGIEYLWRVVLHSPDDVAEKAIYLLKECYTNLSPRLHSNQVNGTTERICILKRDVF